MNRHVFVKWFLDSFILPHEARSDGIGSQVFMAGASSTDSGGVSPDTDVNF